MERLIHDSVITKEEKYYLLNINAEDFINELSTKDILKCTLKDFNIINNVSLICLYNMLFIVIALYFPNSLTEKHKDKIDILKYISKDFDAEEYPQVKIQMTVLTGYMWEESKTKTYKYSIQFSNWGYNTTFIIMDEVVTYSLCMEHVNIINFNKELIFNEWLLNMLLLYNDFVDTLVKCI